MEEELSREEKHAKGGTPMILTCLPSMCLVREIEESRENSIGGLLEEVCAVCLCCCDSCRAVPSTLGSLSKIGVGGPTYCHVA